MENFLLLHLRMRKNYYYRDSWKSDNFMESNKKKTGKGPIPEMKQKLSTNNCTLVQY